jgi:hypothetical protein
MKAPSRRPATNHEGEGRMEHHETSGECSRKGNVARFIIEVFSLPSKNIACLSSDP